MRFIENGPFIPDDLLLARDEGRVLFFCGAGVSRAKANLADFYGLTDLVLNKLRVPINHSTRQVLNEAKEIGFRTGASGLISADRIFGLLEKEFEVQDVEEAVVNALRSDENVDLSAHRIILDLATTHEGKLRLVTTNFDRLFEACLETPKIWHPPRLPDPTRKDEFHGIIHLHGIANQDYERAEGEGLILSSSDFGRAYLAEGWATQFIREILNHYVVVFIGYGADDPPIQYLLESLNKTHGQLTNVYAFQEGTEQEAIGKWTHRGVEAIAYDNKNDYCALWDTLAAWAKRAQSPECWYQSVIELAQKGPEVLQPFERGLVTHVVSSLEGARRFSEGNEEVPPAEWLCVFDPAQRYTSLGKDLDFYGSEELLNPFDLFGLDSDIAPQLIDSGDRNAKHDIPITAWSAFTANKRDRQNLQDWNFSSFYGHWAVNQASLAPRLKLLGNWLAKVAGQPAAVWWAARQTALHPEVQDQIREEITYGSKAIEPTIRRAWRYLFDSWERQKSYNQHSVKRHFIKITIKKEGWSNQCLREYATLNRPYLKVENNFRRNLTPPKCDDKLNLNAMLTLKVKYPERVNDIQIHDDWLALCVQELRKNLEYALQLEKEIYSRRVIPISPIHSEGDSDIKAYSRRTDLYDYVIHFSESFKSLLKLDVAAARKEFSLWPASDQDVFDRLRIWAVGMPELVSDQNFVSILLELSDDIFWDSGSRRDLLLVLAHRWHQLTIENLTAALEARLLAGPPRWDTESEQDFMERNAHVTLNILHWLAKQGCSFTFELNAETERLGQHVPNWTQNQINNAVESIETRGGFVSYNEDYSALLSEELSTILSKALELSGRSDDFLIENAPFIGLCAAKPVRAFSALTHAAKNNEFPKWAWERFLYSPARDNDKPKFASLIAAKIASYSPENLITIIYPISQWLKKIVKTLVTEFYPIYLNVIDKLIATIEFQPSAIESAVVRRNKPIDWIFEAINSPVGHIVEISMSDPELSGLNKNTNLPNRWVSQIDRLLALPDDLRRYALVLLAKKLEWFHHIDPNWTEKSLLVVFSSENSEDQQAVWSGFLWASHTPSQPLYMNLKSQMLNFAKNGDFSRQELEKPLIGIILAGWGSIDEKRGERCVSNEELHDLILYCDDESRCHLIWHLESWSNKDNDWTLLLPQLFKDVWPRQRIAKTPRVSLALFELLFSSIERFEQIAEVILPLLTTIKLDYLDLSSIESILDKHPEQSLQIFYKVFSEVVPINLPYALDQSLDRIADANQQLRADPRWLQLKRKWKDRYYDCAR